MATQNYFKVKNGLEFPSIETLQTTDNTGPSIKPSLNLDFAKTKSLDPRITFTRASTATYYDGETTSRAEENQFLYSQDFTNAYWTKAAVTITGSQTAPDGTSTANLVTTAAGSNYHFVYSTAACNGSPITQSVYVKSNGYPYFMIRASSLDSTYRGALFDLTLGVIVGYENANTAYPVTATIVNAGSGWYRCSVTYSYAIQSQIQFLIQPYNTTSVNQWSADGASGIYLWGAQLEQRAYATAYTPTTTSPITNYIPILQTAGANTARFDHDPVTGESKGLLIEEARTNLVTYSNNFETSTWNKVNSSTLSKACIAPDGTQSGTKIVENTGGGTHGLFQVVGISGNTTYTKSVYMKAGERTWGKINMFEGTSGAGAYYNLATGVLGNVDAGASATITPVGNGWYRCTFTSTMASGATGDRIQISAAVNGADSYTGDGYSGIYIWGAQVEAGSFATSYIPTTLTYAGRGSTATYRGSNGLIQTAAVNVARYESNHTGGSNILVENAATNYSTYSTQPLLWDTSYGSGTNQALAPAAVPAPDGSMTAAAFVSKISTAGDHVLQGPLTTLSSGTVTASIYVKAFGVTSLRFAVASSDINSRFRASYYLSTGTIDTTGSDGGGGFTYTSSSITDVGGGWYRLTLTGVVGSACKFYLVTQQSTNVFSWAQPQGTGVYVWGGQIETGSTATSLIPSVESFTGRSSTATYYDSTGTIRTAASGQARYTYNPSLLSAAPKLLLESSATNVVTNSSSPTWPNSGITYTANAIAAPDGSTTATAWTETASNTYQRSSANLYHQNGNIYTVSIFAKAGARNWVTLDYGPLVYFNLTNGSVSTVPTGTLGLIGYGSQYVSNGWWRFWVTYAYDAVGGTIYLGSSATGADGGLYTGNSSSPAFYAWGIQKEIGFAPSSYIPTSGSQVTRAADTSTSAAQLRSADIYSSSQVTRLGDTASITGSNFSSWYRQDEGSLYGETVIGGVLPANAYGQVFDIRSTSGDRMSLFYNPGTTNNVGYFASTSGISQAVLYGNASVNSIIKLSAAYKANDFAFTYNGSNISVDSSGIIPTATFANIGNNSGSPLGQQWIKKIAYYPKRLSNAELVSITAQ